MCVWERNNWQLRLQLQLRLQFGCIYTSATKFSAASTTLHKSFISAFYMTRTSVMGPCSLINSLPNVTAAGIQSNFLYQEKHTHMHRGCICERMDELDRAHQSESMWLVSLWAGLPNVWPAGQSRPDKVLDPAQLDEFWPILNMKCFFS